MAISTKDLLKDKYFVKKIFKMNIPEKIQNAFLDKGIEVLIRGLEKTAKNVSELIN